MSNYINTQVGESVGKAFDMSKIKAIAKAEAERKKAGGTTHAAFAGSTGDAQGRHAEAERKKAGPFTHYAGMLRMRGVTRAQVEQRKKAGPPAHAKFAGFTGVKTRTDAQGRQVATVERKDLVRFLKRRSYLGDFIAAGVAAPAQTPYDNARVMMIESLADQDMLFDVDVGGVIAEIYEATPYQVPNAEVSGFFSKLKKGLKKVAKGIGKAAKAVIKNPIMKKIGMGLLVVGGVAAAITLGPAAIGIVGKFAGSLVGKAASAAAKLLGGGKAEEEQSATSDPESPTNVPEQLFTKGQNIYVAETSVIFDTPSATANQDQLKATGQTGQGAVGAVSDIVNNTTLGQFYKATWVLPGTKNSTGWVHQSMLSANLIPPAAAEKPTPTSEEMNALNGQLATIGQKHPDAAQMAETLAETRSMVGKTADQAIEQMQKKNAETKEAMMVKENDEIPPNQVFMLDAWIGTPVVGGMVVGQTTQLESPGGGMYVVNDSRGVHGGYTPAYDDGLTAMLGKSPSGRENPLLEWDKKVRGQALIDIQRDGTGWVVGADAETIKPGQKLDEGTLYKANVPLVIKNGKAVHAKLLKRIITNKWTWIGLGGVIILGTGAGVAIHMNKKKKTVGSYVGRRVRSRRKRSHDLWS